MLGFTVVIQNIFTGRLYEFTPGSLPEHFCGKVKQNPLLSNAQQKVIFFEVLNFTNGKFIKTYITDCENRQFSLSTRAILV